MRIDRDWYADDPEPRLAELLADIERFVRRFVVLRSDAQSVAIALWIAHTWTFEAAHETTYLAISSPERESGKSRLLEVLQLLARSPWYIVRPSEAVLFRAIEKQVRSVLLDEYDTVFGKGNEYEGIRAFFNAGHRRGATVPRVVGEGSKMDIKEFPVWCPKALAGIKGLPDTIASRSTPIRLQRRRRSERVDRFRPRLLADEVASLTERLESWSVEAIPALEAASPLIPDELTDRQADGWESLLAIAESAGSAWTEDARAAAIALAGDTAADETIGILLLQHLREIFGDATEMSTESLLNALVERDDGPWADWWGPAVSKGEIRGPASKLSYNLKHFDIRPGKYRVDAETTARGYQRVDLEPVWERYLPPSPGISEQTEQRNAQESEQEQQTFENEAPEQGSSDVPTVPTYGDGGEEEPHIDLSSNGNRPEGSFDRKLLTCSRCPEQRHTYFRDASGSPICPKCKAELEEVAS